MYKLSYTHHTISFSLTSISFLPLFLSPPTSSPFTCHVSFLSLSSHFSSIHGFSSLSSYFSIHARHFHSLDESLKYGFLICMQNQFFNLNQTIPCEGFRFFRFEYEDFRIFISMPMSKLSIFRSEAIRKHSILHVWGHEKLSVT